MSKKIPVLITTDKDKRGVFMGYIDEKDLSNPSYVNDKLLVAEDVRMCVYWSADVKGVLGLAATGPSKGSRVTGATPKARLHGVDAVMDITKEAEKAWLKEPWA